MKNLYLVSIADSQGRMQSYGVSASTRTLAETAARSAAGVAVDAEPQSTVNMHVIDIEAE